MDDAGIKQFGEEWLLSDDVVSILTDVADHAKHAKSDEKDLYVWMAL